MELNDKPKNTKRMFNVRKHIKSKEKKIKNLKKQSFPYCVHKGQVISLPFETKNQIKFELNYNPALRDSYDKKLKLNISYSDSSACISNFEIVRDQSFLYLLSTGNKIRLGTAGPKSSYETIKFRITNKLSELISISTSSLSYETSSSAPSMILHQLVSTILLTAVENGVMIFENEEHPGKPDLTFVGAQTNKPMHIDITTSKQMEDKIKKYPDLWTLDKYILIDKLYGNNQFVKNLVKTSLVNDNKDVSWVTETLKAQGNPDRDHNTIYNEDFLKRLLKYTPATLSKISEVFSKVFNEFVPTLVKPVEKRFKIKDILKSNYSNNFGWLSEINLNKLNYREIPRIDIEFETNNDRFQLESEGTPTATKYFRSDPSVIIQLAQKSYDVLTTYMTKKVESSGMIDLLYYTEAYSTFSLRHPEYFLAKDVSTVKTYISKDENSGKTDVLMHFKTPNVHKHLKQVTTFEPKKYKDVEYSEGDIASLIYSEPMGIDPLDQYVLERNEDSEELVKYVSSSKIYQILVLFKKVSDILSLGVHDSMVSNVKHPYQDLEADIYSSGSVTETDKGIAYITLKQDSKPIRTYLWRATDIRNYKTASRRMCAILSASFKQIPKNRRLRYVTVISLLLLENSWGNSLILKPYRYVSQSFSFSSSLVSKSNDKLNKAISDNRDMVNHKMSLQFMSICLTGEHKANGKTPMFELDLKSAGYEFFLVNLCPPQTYGKRKHRVDMSYEIATELQMARNKFSEVSDRNDSFLRLLDNWGKISPSKYKIEIQDHLRKLDNDFDLSDSRFTYSPLCLILLYKNIRMTMERSIFQGTCPRLSDLQTPKGSFDSYNMKNCSAMESIATLVEKTNLSTTSSIAISLLSYLPLDLTYRMFDKDQVGGNREISIMSAEFRILQSITESFAKAIGRSTQIDMLDNQKKVEMLSDAQNRCTENNGIRETIDQTRWGPNFNTAMFGYMYALMSHHTTEYFIPMITCFLSERKVFQMPTYPELAKYQQTGYTLPGLHGPFHMGQGIFHYTSSLYHSFVSMYVADMRGEALRSLGNINVSSFVTSDDAAIFTYVPSESKRSLSEILSFKDKIRNVIAHYPKVVRFFSIKTSDYKNMVSEVSIEFNSYFLGNGVVGSNSIKFLYSLIDPTTSGNQRRDMESVLDSYCYGLNANLNKYESFILLLSRTIVMTQIWGASSDSILSCLQLWNKIRYDDGSDALIELTAKSVATEREGLMYSPTVLAYKTLEAMSNSINKVICVEQFQPIVDLAVNKIETLKYNKERNLSKNKAITLSRGLRSKGRMIPALKSAIGTTATNVSPLAYLAWIGVSGSDTGFNDTSKSVFLRPYSVTSNAPKGFYAHVYKITPETRMTLSNFVVSSYQKVTSINNSSSQEKIFLHISRKAQIAKLNSNFDHMSLAERIRFFDNQIALNRMSGGAVSLRYSSVKDKSYNTNVFPSLARSLSYMPSIVLLKSNIPSLKNKRNIEFPIHNYFNSKDMKHKISIVNNTSPLYDLNQVTHSDYTLTWSEVEDVAVKMIQTDKTFLDDKVMYLNLKILIKISKIREKKDKKVSISVFDQFMSFMEEEGEDFDINEVSSAASYVLSQANINMNELIDIDDGDDDDFESYLASNPEVARMNRSTIGLGEESFKMYVSSISVEVPAYVNMIRQGWFKDHLIKNSVIYSLINQQFVINETNMQPTELLYSITQGDREIEYSEPIFASGNDRPLFLTSLFDIDVVSANINKSISLNSIAQTTDKQLELLSHFIKDHTSFSHSLLEGGIPGINITDEPKGNIVESSSLYEIYRRIRDEKIIVEEDDDNEIPPDKDEYEIMTEDKKEEILEVDEQFESSLDFYEPLQFEED